jgi:hypothetical protein
VPRELALIAISLACLVAQWYSYGGSRKWVSILPILIGIVQLLFAICFCISSYVHQQLLSLDCQNFVNHNSIVFFTYLGNSPCAGFHFWKGAYNFQICIRTQFFKGVCTLKCTEKHFIPLTPSIFSLRLSPIQNLKEALNIPPWMYCTIHLLENASFSLQVPSLLSILLASDTPIKTPT